MIQQIIALGIILLILIRLFYLKSKKKISAGDFLFWLIFWSFSALLISGIKWIDKLVLKFGFSASGIEVLLYLAVVILFYSNFRMRLKIEKMDRDMTKIVRKISLDMKEQK